MPDGMHLYRERLISIGKRPRESQRLRCGFTLASLVRQCSPKSPFLRAPQAKVRLSHFSRRTERVYTYWVKRSRAMAPFAAWTRCNPLACRLSCGTSSSNAGVRGHAATGSGDRDAACDDDCAAGDGGELPRVAAFIRDLPVGGWLRHSDG